MNVDFNKMISMVKESWELFKGDVGFYLISTIIVGLVAGCTFGILAGPMTVGFLMLIMKKFNGDTVAVGDLFATSKQKFVPALILGIVLILASMISNIIPVIGSLAVSLLVMFAPAIMADEDNIAPIDAIKKSAEMFTSNWQPVVMGFVTMFVLNMIGSFICGIGCLVTAPMSMIFMVKLYALIKGQAQDVPAAAAAESAAPAAAATADASASEASSSDAQA